MAAMWEKTDRVCAACVSTRSMPSCCWGPALSCCTTREPGARHDTPQQNMCTYIALSSRLRSSPKLTAKSLTANSRPTARPTRLSLALLLDRGALGHELLRETQRVGRADDDGVGKVNLARAHLADEAIQGGHLRGKARQVSVKLEHGPSVGAGACALRCSMWAAGAVGNASSIRG
mmetsp:Transcript_4593/g.13891  ORF Transcript_4593/g.13891 Transcript_4593/m.13891 type:complete len:176 (+) Transcript_4593:426-953(+)